MESDRDDAAPHASVGLGGDCVGAVGVGGVESAAGPGPTTGGEFPGLLAVTLEEEVFGAFGVPSVSVSLATSVLGPV
eukprot:3713145-Rhodomonas_salina.1